MEQRQFTRHAYREATSWDYNTDKEKLYCPSPLRLNEIRMIGVLEHSVRNVTTYSASVDLDLYLHGAPSVFVIGYGHCFGHAR